MTALDDATPFQRSLMEFSVMPLLLVDMDSHAVRACNRAFEMWCDRPKPGAVLADVTGLDAARGLEAQWREPERKGPAGDGEPV